MNLKYIGEAVALLGIAYSIVRWIARNVDGADARSTAILQLELGASRIPPHAGGGAAHEKAGETMERMPRPALPPDPDMLDAAAAMFGISRDRIERMDPRERALLLSGYRAAREAQRGPDRSRNGQSA